MPDATDGKIEIVWPQGLPLTAADRAEVGAWLFYGGNRRLVPCQWSPTVYLWKAIDNNPAFLVGTMRKNTNSANHIWVGSNVDVSQARDPDHRVFFYLTADADRFRSNVWGHAVDGRTYFPNWDMLERDCSQLQ